MALSKIKIYPKAVAACDDLKHADESNLIFFNNRAHHTNLHKRINQSVEIAAPKAEETQDKSPSSKVDNKSKRDFQKIIQKSLNRK
jgi:hypothetical protein